MKKLDKEIGKLTGGAVGKTAPAKKAAKKQKRPKNTKPLREFVKDFKSIVCRFGAKSPEDFIYKKPLFGDWQNIKGVDMKLTVDGANGDWSGNVGVVTTILKPNAVDVKTAIAVVCGPPIMMKFVTLKLLEYGFKPENIYLSMEKNMSCGFGKCGHCMLGKYYVCKDGPVFTYDQVSGYSGIWD